MAWYLVGAQGWDHAPCYGAFGSSKCEWLQKSCLTPGSIEGGRWGGSAGISTQSVLPGSFHPVSQALREHCCHLSVTKSCPTLCDPVDCITPGFFVFHSFPEFAQAHVHWVDDVIQPSYPLSPNIRWCIYRGENQSSERGICRGLVSAYP